MILNNYLVFISALRRFAQTPPLEITEGPKMVGAIRKIAKIVAFPVFVGVWLAGWTLYSNNPKAQVSDEKWKMIIIPREACKK